MCNVGLILNKVINMGVTVYKYTIYFISITRVAVE